jgi:hypothetical protein
MRLIKNIWVWITGLLLLAGCGQGASSGTTGLMVGYGGLAQGKEVFALRVIDAGQSAASQPGGAWLETRDEGDGTVAVDVHVRADGLRELYCALDYDAGSYTPVGAASSGLLGHGDDLLELAVLSEPGTAYLGQALVRKDGAPAAFSGEGVAARFKFKAGGSRATAGASKHKVPVKELPGFKLEPSVEQASPFETYFKWSYFNPGDYDQNGEVAITDLSALATVFGAASPSGSFAVESLESVVDGDGNGEINVADITIIAENLDNTVSGFQVFTSANASDIPQDGGVPNGAGSQALVTVVLDGYVADSAQGRHEYHIANPRRQGEYYWVRVEGQGSELGSPSAAFYQPALTPPLATDPGPALALVDGASLQWYYANPGDYNQSGAVESTDLNMIAVFFGQSGPWPDSDVRTLVDGNQDAFINMMDVNEIAKNLNRGVEGYNIYASADPADYPASASAVSSIEPFASVEHPNVLTQGPPGSDTARVSYTVAIPVALQGQSYWVRPYCSGVEGVASELVAGN